jgi:orotate phosphoribosyltransferase
MEVMGMVSIFTYGFPVATENFEKAGVPYVSLTNYTTLIELAVEKGIVSPDQQGILMEWRKDPAVWMKS